MTWEIDCSDGEESGNANLLFKKKNQKLKPKSVMRPDTHEKVLFHIQEKRGVYTQNE